MKIYLIRHGETKYNRDGIHQGMDVPLSDVGREQIQKTAEMIQQDIPATKLITSDLLRAKQSAGILSETLGLTAEESSLFREVKRPSELIGTKHFGPTTIKVGWGIIRNLHRLDWHYSDEESMRDVQDRVDKTREYLAELAEEHDHVLVVSHAFYINIFYRYVCARTPVHMVDYLRMLTSAKFLHNASISTLSFEDDDDPLTCDWVPEGKNDYSHLL